MNFNELRSEMILHDINNDTMASILKISRSAWYRKMSGKVDFTREEIQSIIEALHLCPEKVVSIFFGD